MCGNDAMPGDGGWEMYLYAHKHTHTNLKISLYPESLLGREML